MRKRTRARLAAAGAVAVAGAVLGAVAVLAIGKATGWLDGADGIVVETLPPAATSDGAPGQGMGDSGIGFDPAQLYRERSGGVVTIYALFPGHGQEPGGEAQGSGFVVSSDGYILTNSHVITTAGEVNQGEPVEAAESIIVEFQNGDRTDADIVGWDLFDDVGLIRVEPSSHELEPVPLGDSSQVEVGEPVAAIGSPFGQAGSLSVGVVSATERAVSSLTSAYAVVDVVQTDAPINRGNSGGPLFNARGEVIGVNAQIRSESGNAEGVGFAIPINAARRSMEQLIATGRVRYAWVGLSTQSLTPSIARELGLAIQSGAAIQEVRPGSPAARAGLRAGTEQRRIDGIDFLAGGDVVVAIEGQRVERTEDLIRIVTGALEPGQRVTFTIDRGGKRLDVPVTLAERPANPDAGR